MFDDIQVDPRAAGPWSFWLECCERSGMEACREGKSLNDNPWSYFVEREYWVKGWKIEARRIKQ
jgi:ribosome modulation factor